MSKYKNMNKYRNTGKYKNRFTRQAISKHAIAIALILMIIAIAATFTSYAALTVNKSVLSAGSVTVSADLTVYSDSACQNNLTSVNWGTPTPGTNVTKTIYIKNTGSGVSLALSMNTSGWNPTSANGPITLTWDQEGTKLNPGQSTAAILTLKVSSTIVDVTNFSVSISITGTQ
jgi:uncharacterized protein YcnI